MRKFNTRFAGGSLLRFRYTASYESICFSFGLLFVAFGSALPPTHAEDANQVESMEARGTVSSAYRYGPTSSISVSQLQMYAAMLPPSLQNIIHAEGVPRLRFDQDDVRFELRGVRCGLPTIRQRTACHAFEFRSFLFRRWLAEDNPTFSWTIKPDGDFIIGKIGKLESVQKCH
jgi:hypothetical protein